MSKTILYIDDDRDYLDAVRAIIESGGYEMVEAQTAEEGLKVYRETNPDFVIVDLMMEEVDAGTTFVKELCALGNEVPVYMLSSVGESLMQTTPYVELGLTGVFQKPIVAEHLLAVIRDRLGE
jgi:DNA-binding response OmpR family regulator